MLGKTKTLLPWPYTKAQDYLVCWMEWFEYILLYCKELCSQWVLGGSGDTWTSQADGEKTTPPCVWDLISEPDWGQWGLFPLIFAGQGHFQCVEGEKGWALQAGQSLQAQLAEVEPGQCSYTCEIKVLLLLWLSDILSQEQKHLGSKPAMCLLSVHLFSTKEGVSQAWSSFCLGQ